MGESGEITYSKRRSTFKVTLSRYFSTLKVLK